jgi:hypothetical protein
MTNLVTHQFVEFILSLRGKASDIRNAAKVLEEECIEGGFEADTMQICLKNLEEKVLAFRKAFEPEKWDLDVGRGQWVHQEWHEEEEEEEEG